MPDTNWAKAVRETAKWGNFLTLYLQYSTLDWSTYKGRKYSLLISFQAPKASWRPQGDNLMRTDDDHPLLSFFKKDVKKDEKKDDVLLLPFF